MLIEHFVNVLKVVISVRLTKMSGLFVLKKCQLCHSKYCHQHQYVVLYINKIHIQGPKG